MKNINKHLSRSEILIETRESKEEFKEKKTKDISVQRIYECGDKFLKINKNILEIWVAAKVHKRNQEGQDQAQDQAQKNRDQTLLSSKILKCPLLRINLQLLFSQLNLNSQKSK